MQPRALAAGDGIRQICTTDGAVYAVRGIDVNYLYVIFAVAHLAIGGLVIQAAAKQKSLGLWLLALVSIGLAYDNAILGIGALIGAGDTLLQLNIVRFAIHAIATPLMMIAGLTLARNASVNWTWRRSMSIFVYVTTLSCIVYGANEYLTGAAFKIADSGVMRYVLAESHGPPLGAITTMTFLIAFGIALYIQERSWWLLAGALTMFASATFQLGIIENIGEVLLMVSFLATAQKFTYINRAGYLAAVAAMNPEDRATQAEAQRGRKRKSAIWNRGLAWVIFVSLTVDTIAYYGSNLNDKAIYAAAKLAQSGAYVTHLYASNIYLMLFFVHAVASLYFYGIPRLRANIRAIHVYIGYGVFIFTMVSQSLIGMEPIHMITYVINWAFIAAHIVLSFRFMLQRVRRANVDPMLELTVSPHLREPIAQ